MNKVELRAIKTLIKLYEEMVTVTQDENRKMKRILMEGEEKFKLTEERVEIKDLVQKMMLLKEIIGI
jgi:hypothetical protein